MGIFKRAYCFLLLLAAAIGVGRAATSYQYAGEFLNLGAGARGTGIGNTFIAKVDDATATYWNPAGLARLGSREITFMHSEQFADIINYDFAAYAHPIKGVGGMGIALVRLGLDGIKLTRLADTTAAISKDNPVLVDRTVSNSDYCLMISQGRLLERINTSVGMTVKLIRRMIGDYYANGIGFDLGVQYALRPSIQIGISVKDFTRSIVTWDNGTRDYIYPSFHLGAAASRYFQDFHGTFTLSAGSYLFSDLLGNYYLTEQLGIGHTDLLEPIASGGLGLEYNYQDKFFLRGGTFMDNVTFGTGLTVLNYTVDFAMMWHSVFDDRFKNDLPLTTRVSGSVKF